MSRESQLIKLAREIIPDFDTKIERQATIRHEQIEWYEHDVLFEYGLEYVITTLAGKHLPAHIVAIEYLNDDILNNDVQQYAEAVEFIVKAKELGLRDYTDSVPYSGTKTMKRLLAKINKQMDLLY